MKTPFDVWYKPRKAWVIGGQNLTEVVAFSILDVLRVQGLQAFVVIGRKSYGNILKLKRANGTWVDIDLDMED